MLDPTTGVLTIVDPRPQFASALPPDPNGAGKRSLQLGPDLTRKQFLSAMGQKFSRSDSAHGGGEWVYSVLASLPDGHSCFIRLSFFSKWLYDLDVSLIDPSWDRDYPEQRRKEFHDRWLMANNVQADKAYEWGLVSSDYDPRSDSSSIGILYPRHAPAIYHDVYRKRSGLPERLPHPFLAWLAFLFLLGVIGFVAWWALGLRF